MIDEPKGRTVDGAARSAPEGERGSIERELSDMGAVLGNYRITGALGSGGMGAVYRAEDVKTGKAVAVKVLRKELSDNDEVVQRFFNEARAATKIRHPGIIEVFDFGYDSDGRAYLAMELLSGITLRERIAAVGKLPEAEARVIAQAIATALAAAHANGIIHRDLKPDNIFLVAGQPKILDFGIAKLTDLTGDEASRTRTGSLIGTPVYMAPEQARAAGAIDPRADLYSFGCILYEMVVGNPPFSGNVGELLAAHMFNAPDPARAHAKISAALDALITQLLAKDPADRPANAQAVADALGNVRMQSPTHAPPLFDSPQTLSELASAAPPTLTPSRTASRSFGEGRPEELVAKRSAMPIIAAVATIAIAGVTLGLVFLRGGGDERAAAAPAPTADTVILPALPPTPPPTPTPAPSPGPVPKRVVDQQDPVSPTKKPAKPDQPPKRIVETAPAHDKPDKPDKADRRDTHDSNGPVTMPSGPVTTPDPGSAVVTKPEPLVTPKGAPLSPDP